MKQQRRPIRNRFRIAAIAVAAVLAGSQAAAYPLDGGERTGIRRLEGYRAAQERSAGPKLPRGSLLATDDIRLSLVGAEGDIAGLEKDASLQAALESIFRPRDPSYSVAVVDITNPQSLAWAGIREDRIQSPGSVGKVLCMIALFDGLRRAFPEVAQRERVLRETVVEATDWTVSDEHQVPRYDPEAGRNRFAVIVPGDRFRLSEWVDHMISASANAAGATVWKEAMLLRHFGKQYPPSQEQEAAFFASTPKSALQKLSQEVINEPLAAAGIDLAKIQQGSMWTRVSKTKVPGLPSFASPRELVRVLLRIEQGRLVDPWSSLEMKRYLYMTKKRYRYVYAPELAAAAVYFKSGSLYQCVPEEGYRCGKYRGNGKNFMNSIVVVEIPAGESDGQRRYIVALMSNVLRVNSAWDHSRLGAAIDEVVRTRQPTTVKEKGTAAELEDVGRGQ